MCSSRYDDGRDGFLDLEELKRMMEKLGAPQTHLDLKAMIKEVDEDGDNKISFREVNIRIRLARTLGVVDLPFYGAINAAKSRMK